MYAEVFDLLKGVSNIDERKKGGLIKHPLVLGSVNIFKDSITTTEEQFQGDRIINDYLQACLESALIELTNKIRLKNNVQTRFSRSGPQK